MSVAFLDCCSFALLFFVIGCKISPCANFSTNQNKIQTSRASQNVPRLPLSQSLSSTWLHALYSKIWLFYCFAFCWKTSIWMLLCKCCLWISSSVWCNDPFRSRIENFSFSNGDWKVIYVVLIVVIFFFEEGI